MKHILLLTACAFVFCAGVFAQKDDKKWEQWPVAVRLNLMITDANGNPVNNIAATDIKLYENDVEQKVTNFVKKPVSNIAFVMDNSGSLREQIGVIEQIGDTIVDNFNKTESAAVIRFVGRDKITTEQPVTTNKALLKKAFSRMFTEGGETALRDAVYLTAQALLEGSKDHPGERSAIVLLTDGEDRDSYYKDSDIFSLIGSSDIQIFVVGLTTGLNAEPGFIRVTAKDRSIELIDTLALRTGGAAYILDSPRYKSGEIDRIVSSIIDELHSPYVVGYTSTDQNHDGEWRKIRVEIADGPNGEKRTAVVRNSFVVPKN